MNRVDDMAVEPWRGIFEEGADGQYLFHYTPLSTAVESILPSRRLRFSRFTNMRDPRETEWAIGAVFMGEIDDPDRLYWETVATIEMAKETVRILSLTADRGGEMSHPFGRGYAHPRLWEQYGGNHVGVCLCLEREALRSAVKRAASEIGVTFREGRVQYRDGQITPRASMVDLQQARKRGALQLVEEHFDEHLDELFFTKLTDWESEVEYRFVMRWDSDKELFVDISDALRAIVVGHGVAREYAPAVLSLAEPWGVGPARVWWNNGAPVIHKFTAKDTRG